MRLQIAIDAMNHQIDSTDPELLGKWIMEMFARVADTWSPATQFQVYVQPSWLPTRDGRGRADWIADSRVMGRIYDVKTPRELLDALAGQIEELEKLHGRDDG
jgi:hypothetical protein